MIKKFNWRCVCGSKLRGTVGLAEFHALGEVWANHHTKRGHAGLDPILEPHSGKGGYRKLREPSQEEPQLKEINLAQDGWMSLSDVARRRGVSKVCAGRWCLYGSVLKDGTRLKLKSVRVGWRRLVREADLLEFFETIQGDDSRWLQGRRRGPDGDRAKAKTADHSEGGAR